MALSTSPPWTASLKWWASFARWGSRLSPWSSSSTSPIWRCSRTRRVVPSSSYSVSRMRACEKLQAAPHHLAHSLGNRDAPGLHLLRTLQAAIGHQQAHDLVEEEGVALGLPVDGLHKRLGRRQARRNLD